MYALVERLALPALGLIWISAILIMAWFAFRGPVVSRKLMDQHPASPVPKLVRPQGPMTATQLAAVSRRRRLAR